MHLIDSFAIQSYHWLTNGKSVGNSKYVGYIITTKSLTHSDNCFATLIFSNSFIIEKQSASLLRLASSTSFLSWQ